MQRNNNVTAVIVTYGSRFVYVEKVIEGALNAGVGRIIIVFNGKDSVSVIHKKYLNRVFSVILEKNTGSAGGFKAGLEEALRYKETELVWLLDDDNLPAEDSLDELIKAGNGGNIRVVCSYRPVRPEHRKWFTYKLDKDIVSSPNSCCGFSISELSKLVTLSSKKTIEDKGITQKKIKSCTYGGMLIPRNLIDRVGFPNTDFILYCDDTDYSYRLTKLGADLILVKTSIIHDLEMSWSEKKTGRKTIFSRLLLADSQLRARYRLRNSIYLSVQYKVDNWLYFYINVIVFCLGILAVGLFNKKTKTSLRLIGALFDGLKGRLGFLEGNELEFSQL